MSRPRGLLSFSGRRTRTTIMMSAGHRLSAPARARMCVHVYGMHTHVREISQGYVALRTCPVNINFNRITRNACKILKTTPEFCNSSGGALKNYPAGTIRKLRPFNFFRFVLCARKREIRF